MREAEMVTGIIVTNAASLIIGWQLHKFYLRKLVKQMRFIKRKLSGR